MAKPSIFDRIKAAGAAFRDPHPIQQLHVVQLAAKFKSVELKGGFTAQVEQAIWRMKLSMKARTSVVIEHEGRIQRLLENGDEFVLDIHLNHDNVTVIETHCHG